MHYYYNKMCAKLLVSASDKNKALDLLTRLVGYLGFMAYQPL